MHVRQEAWQEGHRTSWFVIPQWMQMEFSKNIQSFVLQATLIELSPHWEGEVVIEQGMHFRERVEYWYPKVAQKELSLPPHIEYPSYYPQFTHLVGAD